MLKRHTIHLLLAAMMLHLAACSSPRGSAHLTSNKTSTQQHLLTDHQTNRFLKQWDAAKYSTKLPNQKIVFTNKHSYAPSFHQIISGFSVSTFCHRTEGIGLPVIVQTDEFPFKPITSRASQSNLYPGSLVVLRKANGDMHVTLLDPRTTRKQYGRPVKTQHKLVIDHINNLPNNHALSLRGLLNPLQFQHLQGFYLSEPYDKRKIPIIMIHGIFSSPKAFTEMAETIEDQPDLFKKYQIWHYYYPTGTPWLSTAHDFRASYRELIHKLDPRGHHHNLRKTTIIAHSMGGLITRLSLSQPKNHLADAYLGQHGAKFLTKKQMKKTRSLFHYRPLTEPQQIIFLAVPHRGSKMASGAIGWCAEKFIAIPNMLIKGTVGVILPQQKSKLSKDTLRLLTEGENAVNQLEPNNPAIKALNKMQLPKRLKVHSIVGDITLPLFRIYSDGVVTYRSSHLGKTGSEITVSSNHDVTDHPKAIQRVIEILRN